MAAALRARDGHGGLNQWLCLRHQAYTYINNILLGKRYLDHRGPYYVTCVQTGDTFQCRIQEPIVGKAQHEVSCWQHVASLTHGS